MLDVLNFTSSFLNGIQILPPAETMYMSWKKTPGDSSYVYLSLSNNFVKGAPTSLFCVRHNHVTQIIKHVTPYTYWYCWVIVTDCEPAFIGHRDRHVLLNGQLSLQKSHSHFLHALGIQFILMVIVGNAEFILT